MSRLEKVLFMATIVLLIPLATLSAQNYPTRWSDWNQFDSYPNISYRIRCTHLNSANHMYNWEMEVQNNTDKNLNISATLSDANQDDSQNSYGSATIQSGGSHIFHIIFLNTAPGGGTIRAYMKSPKIAN